jgi:regulatory protein
MKITGIEKKSGTRYTVYVDEEYFYIFDAEILTEFRVKTGMEVDEAFLEELKRQADVRRARERAFYLLSYRDHSEKELYDKLRRNVPDEIAAQTVAKMVDLGLLDDGSYARKLAEYYLTQKRWSFRKSLFELKRKGIDEEAAAQALSDCGISAKEQIRELIEQKYYRYLGDQKGSQKVLNALARLGFSYSDSRAAMSEYLEELELGEEDEWQYE